MTSSSRTSVQGNKVLRELYSLIGGPGAVEKLRHGRSPSPKTSLFDALLLHAKEKGFEVRAVGIGQGRLISEVLDENNIHGKQLYWEFLGMEADLELKPLEYIILYTNQARGAASTVFRLNGLPRTTAIYTEPLAKLEPKVIPGTLVVWDRLGNFTLGPVVNVALRGENGPHHLQVITCRHCLPG